MATILARRAAHHQADLKVAQQGLDPGRGVFLRVLLAQVGACQEFDAFAGLQRLVADAEFAFIQVQRRFELKG